jgi:flavin reductase (DIM6/NTAB) family NADH-FMN oxidoreductase RutF
VYPSLSKIRGEATLKIECELKDVFEVTNNKLENGGLLLTSVGSDKSYNVMTIGWGLLGRLWSEPIFMVAVRPSRYTYTLIEETNEFTVNVPADDMDEILAYCGEMSGRDHDKIKEMELVLRDGVRVKSPMIDNCIIHFECRVIGKSQVLPEFLLSDVKKTYYSSGDYHTLYFGRLLSILTNKAKKK